MIGAVLLTGEGRVEVCNDCAFVHDTVPPFSHDTKLYGQFIAGCEMCGKANRVEGALDKYLGINCRYCYTPLVRGKTLAVGSVKGARKFPNGEYAHEGCEKRF